MDEGGVPARVWPREALGELHLAALVARDRAHVLVERPAHGDAAALVPAVGEAAEQAGAQRELADGSYDLGAR